MIAFLRTLIVAALLLYGHSAAAKEALILADIHFDPTANKALVDRLALAEPEQWAAILAGDDRRMSLYGDDTNWKLLSSTLAAARDQPKPDFVLVLGDFLVHQFRARFNAAASDQGDFAFRSFAAKAMRFLALQLEATFPETPILPTLGNNDSDCGDYGLRPGGDFLSDTFDIAVTLIGPASGAALRQTWQALGNYAVPNPVLRNHLVVALNTNFFSPNYKNACGDASDGNPARATLAWLRRVLEEAEAARNKVWLVYHIPPGIDAFATARHDSCPVAPVPLFAEPYAREFHALMERYRGTVAASFSGHIHTDGFRLLADDGQAFGFVLVSPAVSPIYGQNPAFRRLRLDDDGTVADQSVYYLANLPDAASGAAAEWRLETSFDAAWSLPRFDLSSLEALYRRIGTSSAARDRWLDLYSVEGPTRAAINPKNEAIYRCAAGNDRAADFARCSCAGAAR